MMNIGTNPWGSFKGVLESAENNDYERNRGAQREQPDGENLSRVRRQIVEQAQKQLRELKAHLENDVKLTLETDYENSGTSD